MAETAHVRSSNMKKKQVQLPDVTGLTVAVESPAKGQSYQPYGDTAKDHRDEDGHGLSLASFFIPQLKGCSTFTVSHESPPKEDCPSRCGESYFQKAHEGA